MRTHFGLTNDRYFGTKELPTFPFMNQPGFFARIFMWLSGASHINLAECPPWEQRKYVAFGATVLVPCIFGFIAAAYAVSTLTQDWGIILGVSLVWSFIILTVDRALLATYRAYQSIFRKFGQFILRIVVAALMGVTISHPMTLLLFKDTISSVIEADRDQEILAVRQQADAQKVTLENKIKDLDEEVAAIRLKWDETFQANFLKEKEAQMAQLAPDTIASDNLDPALAAKIKEAQSPTQTKLEAVEIEIKKLTEQSTKIQGELDFWQKEFERELNGQRSGIVGVGPRAKSIQSDQLDWRRDESKRLTGLLEVFSADKTRYLAELDAISKNLQAEAQAQAEALALKQKEEEARVNALRQQVEQDQANQFVQQQNQLRESLKSQMDARLAQAQQFQTELVKINEDEQTRVEALRNEPRKDILKQTLALHKLFEQGAQGGTFAFTAYLVLSALFMLVDTIPLMVKFFSKAGPYDSMVDCDEVRYDTHRKAFLKSYQGYMNSTEHSHLLSITKNAPLERTLIDGVDRSKAAKAFLENLLALEKSFQAQVELQRSQAIEHQDPHAVQERLDMIKHLADAFYKDMHQRMEDYFRQAQAAPRFHV